MPEVIRQLLNAAVPLHLRKWLRSKKSARSHDEHSRLGLVGVDIQAPILKKLFAILFNTSYETAYGLIS